MTREESEKYIKSKMCNNCGVYLGGGKCSDNCNVIEAIQALSQEPCEVSEYDKDHIWYKGKQYISLHRFLEVKAEKEPCNDALVQLKKYTEGKQNTDKVEISVLTLNRIIKALSQEPKLTGICNECLKKNGCEMYSQLIKSGEKYTVESCEKYISKPCVLDRRVDENTVVFKTIDGKEVEYIRKDTCEDVVSRGVFEQVMWERDIAIEQLHELGYELGQKIEPCDDAISRKDIQDYIAEYLSQYLYEDVRQAVEVIDAYIGDMPSVTQKSGKWIPFNERLPKPFEHCLITTTDGEVIYHYDDGHYSKYKAWMPLPTPYEPQESEDKE